MFRKKNKQALATSREVDSYFHDTNRGASGDIEFSDLPYITRPLIEYIHDYHPSAIIASDRGGRLVAFAVMHGWHRRYPGEHFPTEDGRIHFARVTSRSATEDNVRRAVHYALGKAGIAPVLPGTDVWRSGQSPRVMLLDDWAVYGGTAKVFSRVMEDYGIPASALAYGTMCGKQVGDMPHIIGDPDRDPRRSEWENKSNRVGVAFSEGETDDRVTPYTHALTMARRTRREIAGYIDAYYARYNAALAAGQIAACACIDAA